MNPPVNSLGGKMYGDGVYVVEFSGGGGVTGSPLVAHVIVGFGDGEPTLRSAKFGAYEKPSVKLASDLIATARRMDAAGMNADGQSAAVTA